VSRLFALLVAASLLSACAIYEMPRVAAEERAVLTLQNFETRGRKLFFTEIDGKPLSTVSALGIIRWDDPVILLPGKHTVGVQYYLGLSNGFAKMWFVAEAGKSYVVRTKDSGYSFRAWIEDAATGQPTGGLWTGE
jgi:hypothetical protein